jgi:hypothetical protein
MARGNNQNADRTCVSMLPFEICELIHRHQVSQYKAGSA